MSEQTAPTTGTENTNEQSEVKPDGFTAITSQEDFDKAIQARIARERAKYADYDDLKNKASKFDEIEAANRTDLENALAQVADLQAKVTTYEQRDQIKAWAEEITKDSPHIPASVLRGSTREELEANFQELSALIPAPSEEPTATQGKPVSTIGQQPESARNVPITEQIAAAEAAGNTALVGALKAMQLGTVKTN